MAQRKVVVKMMELKSVPEEVWPEIDADYVFVAGNSEEELAEVTRDADAVITHIRPPHFTRKVIENMHKCRLIYSMATGFEGIDVEAATEHGICVANGGDYSAEEVSDHAMALLLSCARKIPKLDKTLKENGLAAAQKLFRPMFPLNGQTLGIIGLGRIGQRIVPKAQGFGIKVIAYDNFLSASVFEKLDVESVTLETLLAQSDFISINAPLTAETDGMIGTKQFAMMKPTAYLINCGRGEIVDEGALYTALKDGKIAGAGLDVVANEPIKPDNPLLTLENAIIIPHAGYYSDHSGPLLFRRGLESLVHIFKGEWPDWLVNPEVKDKYREKWGESLK